MEIQETRLSRRSSYSVCEIFEGQQKGIFKHQLGLSGKLDDFGYKELNN
jgi:hypothetical protein